MPKRSQARRLFDILLDGMWHINGELAKQISSSPAGFCMRLTARVHDLRQLGFDIECEPINTRQGIFKYRMVTPRNRIDDMNMIIIPDVLAMITDEVRQTNLFKEIEG